MKKTILPALLIVGLTALWSMIYALAGWHKNVATQSAFFFVIVLQFGVMIWALNHTSKENGYVQQLISGVVMSALAAVLIFLFSYVLTSSMFPNYYTEFKQATQDYLLKQGKTELEISDALNKMSSDLKPVVGAVQGAIGTLATGIVFSLGLSAFFRKK